MSIGQSDRLALITFMSEQYPSGRLGRTVLMKFCYFLQALRQVPLGYRFTLYAYGPFDSNVLADLDNAESLGAVKTRVVYYSGGYGYVIEAAPHAPTVRGRGAAFLKRYEADIQWVLGSFQDLGSAELELVSTMIYVDREPRRASETLPLHELVRRVRDLKPRFPESQVQRHAEWLAGQGLLHASTPGISAAPPPPPPSRARNPRGPARPSRPRRRRSG